jgi:hypothetical protein
VGCPVGTGIAMPLSTFGWSNPNTNSAIRIMAVSGYEPWDTAISASRTTTYDESCDTCSPKYRLIINSSFFWTSHSS